MSRGYRGWITKDRRELVRSRYRLINSPEAKRRDYQSTDQSGQGQQKLSVEQRDERSLAPEQRTESGERPSSTRGEIIIAAFTIVLTFVAIGAAMATYLQWDAAKKALAFAVDSAAGSSKDTQAALTVSSRIATASERQASDAADSAKAAKDTAQASIKSAEIAASAANELNEDRHAVILPRAIEFGDRVIEGNGRSFFPLTFSIENSGRQVARDVAIKYLQQTYSGQSIQLDSIRAGKNRSCSAGNQYTFHVGSVYPATTISRVFGGISTWVNDDAIFLQGCLIYKAGNETHTTKFCYLTFPGVKNMPYGKMVACSDGNEMQ